ncbi:MAG TPA: BON domain-containing protein [Solirubrobacteraceae bacterium]|nr:BON domain-containing protein [Solirubrobacteraceae bacterium]
MGFIDQIARRAGGFAGGVVQKVAGQTIGRARRGRPRDPDRLSDADLARKVESIIFRGDDVQRVDKGRIDVNAADGAVWLRGIAPTPETIKALEAATRAIPEVREVHNLLHLPKTPAPTRTDTPASQRKTRRTPARAGGKDD